MPRPLIGISIKMIAVALVVAISVLIKTYPGEIPISELVFFRVSFSIPFVLLFLWFQTRGNWVDMRKMLTPNNPWLHLRRSILGMLSMALIFLSVRLLPLPIANTLWEMSPIFITLLAALFLGERIQIYRTIGLLFGIFGAVLIAFSTWKGIEIGALPRHAIWGALAAISAALTIAISQIQIRSMVATEEPTAVVFWFFVLTAIVSLLFSPFGWIWPTPQGWLWLIGLGIAGAGTQLAITIAYRFADASTIAPFNYFAIPLSLLVGGVYFNEWPRLIGFIGMAFILAGGLIIIYREGQLARKSHDL